MSRAFMREPDPKDPGCPECGATCEPVAPSTVDAHVPPSLRAPLTGTVFYCANPSCRTAYFNSWGASVPAGQVIGSAWPKDPEGPICPCFGVNADDVLADARDGRKDRVKELVDRSRGSEARCAQSSPDGACCVPRVLRLFRESFDARGG
jgi:CopZ-like zinc binding protein